MADRTVHYEAAFEAFLRGRAIPYVAVDEAKKALFANAKLKSFDFVVYSKNGPNLLVDVKGRSCRNRESRSGFETWATERDVEDLLQWQQVFGEGFEAILTFVYWIDPPLTPEPGMFEFRDRWYLMMGIKLSEYREHMRRRSVKWETVALPSEDFRSLAPAARKLVMIETMISQRQRRLPSVLLGLAALLVALAPIVALAGAVNGEEDVKPDGRLQGFGGTVTPEGGSALTYMFFVVLILITAGVCFMNAKRSHLD